MEELFKVSDRITVMRDGQYIKTIPTNETNKDELVKLMVGRELSDEYPRRFSFFLSMESKRSNAFNFTREMFSRIGSVREAPCPFRSSGTRLIPLRSTA
mgnify:CR=1 FL=1